MDNNSSSSIMMLILAMVVIAVGAFGFLQADSLNNARASLVDSESAGTEVADMLGESQSAGTQVANSLGDSEARAGELESSLGDVQAAGTALAESASAAATQSALDLDGANSLATEFAIAAETEVAGMQESMNAQADAQVTLEADMGAQAEAMSAMEADATAQSDMIAGLMATSTAQSAMLDNAMATAQAAQDLAATQSAELEAMQAAVVEAEPEETASAEETEMAVEPEVTESAPEASADDTADAGTVAFKAVDFEMELPGDFFAYDMRIDQDVAVEDFSSRGFPYFLPQSLAESGTDVAVVVGASETVTEGLADLFLVGNFLDIGPALSMAEVMETVPGNFAGPQTTILEQTVLEDRDREVGFLLTESDFGLGSTFIQAIYIIEGADGYYGIIFQTVETAYEARAGEFEASAFSFTPTSD